MLSSPSGRGAHARKDHRSRRSDHGKGGPLDAKTVEAAAEAAIKDADPLEMNAYKVEITKTLVKKTLLS